ncbi:hypothetical protein C2845_PM01G02750 [Panicum miliaceum]|uniref:tRNA synthetases class I catalytic domain-containing protein n=1 Tax=Panicum miliaceum TaxID=4540 RepID=A0A3L6TPC1_PANMI|nr:hypothetical protein C2845_PM01G02750 [Panicum miliaceum]
MSKPPPPLKLFNSMTKMKEPFKPLVEGKVSMYLKFLGNEVEYVRNFTDIDDKCVFLTFNAILTPELALIVQIIRRANEAGETVESLSSRFINEFSLDMDELQCLPPTREPRVTEHIEHIIELITKIMENGHAYAIEGDVYFSVDSFPEYLQLSGRMLDQNRAGERVAVDTRKRNPADFALWKSAKEGEPFWESPWGRGRPGWHIECSAMSAHYLGHVFDIHGGGKDLIFPHHENEVAQSQAAYPESEVKCWMHNGLVNKDDQKMSKSENNFFTIRDTLYDCEEVLSKYRQEDISIPVPDKKHDMVEKHHLDFFKYMSDDLKTTKVLDESFMKLLRTINSDLDDLKVLKQLKGKTLKRACLTEEQLQEQIEQRTAARKNKQFEVSDGIRMHLASLGISLMDEPSGTIWRPCEPEWPEESGSAINDGASGSSQARPEESGSITSDSVAETLAEAQRWPPRKTIPGSSDDDLGTYPTTPELTPPMPLTRISEQTERESSENSG